MVPALAGASNRVTLRLQIGDQDQGGRRTRSVLGRHDVDVARNDEAADLADLVQKRDEAVVGALERDVDRPLAIAVTVDDLPRLEPQQSDAGRPGQCPTVRRFLKSVSI